MKRRIGTYPLSSSHVTIGMRLGGPVSPLLLRRFLRFGLPFLYSSAPDPSMVVLFRRLFGSVPDNLRGQYGGGFPSILNVPMRCVI